jgi:SAM-dependent methyltransferase
MLRRGGSGIARVCGDACHLPFRRRTFDLINASLMVGDIADLGAWTREMARVLAIGGHLVYSDFHASWAQRGWSRTFRSSDGELHDVSYNPHSIDDHLASLEQAGFRVRTIREPRFGASRDDAARDIKAFRRRWGNPPVVVAFHAVKEP